MKISYPQREEEARPRRGRANARSSSHHLTFIASLTVAIIIIGFVAWWFALRSAQKVEVPEQPVIPTREEAIQEFTKPPLNVDDALTQCETAYPVTSDAGSRQGRVRCYAAVMVLWNTTGLICESQILDSQDKEICREAITMVETFGGNPSASWQNSNGTSQNSNSSAVQGNGNSVSLNSGSSGRGNGSGANLNAPPPGFESSGSQSGNGNVNSSNTGSSGNSNANANTSSGNSNLNTNASDSNPSTQPPANENTNSSSGSEPSQTETAENPETDDPVLCVDESGEIVLLQHTETCQF